MSNLRLQQEQQPPLAAVLSESEVCKKLHSLWDLLEVHDNVVYRRLPAKEGRPSYLQLLAPASRQRDLMLRAHTGLCAGHLGTRKTMDQLQRRAFWCGWRKDVARFCRQCDNCNRYYRGKLPRTAPLQPIPAGAPWEKVCIDLTGPHPRSSRGSVYILTVVDLFTKWAEAFPLPNKEAKTVARVLMEQVFCRHGSPLCLLSDRGLEVDGNVMSEICRLLDIDKMHSTSYHPQTQTACERFHRTLNGMMGKVVSEHQKDWDLWLPYIMAAYRSTQHESTNFTPNFLVLGRETRAGIDLLYGPSENTSPVSSDDFVDEVITRRREAYHLVREQLGKVAEKGKRYYDLRVRPQRYHVGDKVYFYNPRRYQGKQDKWLRKRSGPFTVVKLLGPVNVVIQKSSRTRPIITHVEKLSPYYDQEDFSPVVQPIVLTEKDQADDVNMNTCNDVGEMEDELPIAGYVPDQPLRTPRPRRNISLPARYQD